MSEIYSVLDRYRDIIKTAGRQALNAMFPKEFELYMMSLELTDSDGNLIDYLSFPVLPNNFSQVENKRINVKKTLNGVSIISSKSFVPKQVSMSGDFGKNLKFLNAPEISFAGLAFSTKSGVYSSLDTNPRNPKIRFPEFNPSIKTGYGVIKLLQAIIDKSTSIDAKGKPFRLFFHNPTMGESYLAVPAPNALTINSVADRNMVPSYSLNLILVMPLSQVKTSLSSVSLSSRMTSDFIQRSVNLKANDIKRAIL